MTATAAASETFDGMRCEGCGAQLSVAAGERTTRCPYCASPAVVVRPREGVPDPSFVLAFVVTERAARDTARAWIRSTWFTRGDFAKADVTEMRGVYVPAYLYSAAAHARYTAEIGEHYTVTERRNGRTQTRTKTEWRSLAGEWAAWLDDVFVTASRGLPNDELEAVEPFDTRALRRFAPELLAGWVAEDPSMSETECREIARREAAGQVTARLAQHMPGDLHRDLQSTTQFRHEDLELVLVPVWILAVKYDAEQPPVRLVVNGQTGKLSGRPPRSWLKILITIFAVGAAAALAWLWASVS